LITDYFIERSNGLIKQVPEYRDEGKGYTAFNDGSVECEVGEFLYSIVRILKPRYILETGTYKGVSSSYMGQGLKDNATGFLDTLEIEDQHIQTSKQLWNALDLNKWIIPHHLSSGDFNPTYNYELMFLDSEPNLRFGELVKFFPFLTEGGYVFIHDVPPTLCQGNVNPDHPEIKSWPFGDLPEEIKQWVKEDKLRPIHFPNPRGMLGFYKSGKEYKW
jgi:predicted O-methyltransferase YrrM